MLENTQYRQCAHDHVVARQFLTCTIPFRHINGPVHMPPIHRPEAWSPLFMHFPFKVGGCASLVLIKAYSELSSSYSALV